MIKKSMDESNQGFMKHLGGLELKKISDTQYEFSVEVKEIHLNTGKIAHGGFLASIADTGMGTAAHRVAGDKRCVTINSYCVSLICFNSRPPKCFIKP